MNVGFPHLHLPHPDAEDLGLVVDVGKVAALFLFFWLAVWGPEPLALLVAAVAAVAWIARLAMS